MRTTPDAAVPAQAIHRECRRLFLQLNVSIPLPARPLRELPPADREIEALIAMNVAMRFRR